MHWYSLRKKNFDIIPLKNVESQWQIDGQFTERILESGHEVRHKGTSQSYWKIETVGSGINLPLHSISSEFSEVPLYFCPFRRYDPGW